MTPISMKTWLIIGGVIVFIIAIWWIRHDAYNDGERDTDAKWEMAKQRVRQQAAASATKADDAAIARAAQHDRQVQQERERIDEAQANGSSTLDVLFGTGG